MLRKTDYSRLSNIVKLVVAFRNGDELFSSTFLSSLKNLELDHKNGVVHADDIYRLLYQEKELNLFFGNEKNNDIPIDLFLVLYIHQFLSPNISKSATYKDVLICLGQDSFYINQVILQDDLEFLACSYFISINKTPWLEFTLGFSSKDWSDIFLLASLLPISNASVNDFIKWIEVIVKTQEKDSALGTIGNSVYEWVIHQEGSCIELEKNILNIANHPQVNRFFSAIIKGLKDRQKKKVEYYKNLVEQSINESNAFVILYGIGIISQESEIDRNKYFEFIISTLEKNRLILKDFTRLCSYLNYYNQDVYNRINSTIEHSEERDNIIAIIEFLQRAPADVNKEWFSWATHLSVSKKHPDFKDSLDSLLIKIADFDLNLAYALFTFRLQVMGGDMLLEKALLQMVKKDTAQFQSRFISWLVMNDHWVHNAILFISSLSFLDKSLFSISHKVYSSLTNKEKLFVAYKITGYVYSMEALQSLLLSLIKSIKDDSEALRERLTFLLIEYLVYNYRGTLELIRKDLEDPNLSSFAKSLFETTCNYFDNYFNQLRSIVVDKEISPNKEFAQLRNFYQRKLYADIPKKAEQNSIVRLFKSTDINANNWAIRRPNELKHMPTPLGRISITSEFPSGERLNPIYQEYIRRTYKKLELDEINID